MDSGFLELKTAQDLFAKLEEDLRIACNDPLNSRAWFNFFVTAEHFPEWLYKDINKRSDFKKHAALRVCSHIANGGKHFDIELSKRHNSIVSTAVTTLITTGATSPSSREHKRNNDGREYILKLNPNEAQELGPEISVIELAEQVFELHRKIFTLENVDGYFNR